MKYNTERVGRSPFYERPAHSTKREEEAARKAKICLSCTKKICNGNCELMRRRNGRVEDLSSPI